MARDEHTYGFNQPDARDLVNLIGSDGGGLTPDQQPPTRQPAIFQTPVGGIAARSGTTAGSASCTMYYMDGTTITTTGNSFTVYNIFGDAIGGSVYIVASPVKGGYVLISEDCS